MITEHDLQEAIAECEGQRNPSANTCMKLAAFYTIKDKMFPAERDRANIIPQYSMSAEPINVETDFMQILSELNPNEYLPVMDELMTTLQAIMPKLYDGVMRKLSHIS